MNPEGLDDGKDGCKGIHHIRSPNCARERPARLPHISFKPVLPSRPTANRQCMLAAHGTSHVNKIVVCWHLTLEADPTPSLIDLTCPLTTFIELSAGPLDCWVTFSGRLFHNISSSDRMEGSVSHRNTTLLYPQIVQIFDNPSSPLFHSLGSQLLLRESYEQKLTW